MTTELLISRLNAFRPTREEILSQSPELDEESVTGIAAFFDFRVCDEPRLFKDDLRTIIYNTNIPQLGISDFNFDLDSDDELFCYDDQGFNVIVDGPLFALRYDEEPLHWSSDSDSFFEGIVALFHAHMDFVFRKTAFKTARYLEAIDQHVPDRFLANFFKTRITESFPEE